MGELLAIVSMTLFAAANLAIAQKYADRTSRGGAFLSILMTFVLSFVIWSTLGLGTGFAPVDRVAIVWFALAGVLTALLGRVFLFASIQHLGAVKGAAIKRLNPLFSVILGVVLLGEIVNLPMALGMGLIVASFVVLIRESLQAEALAGSHRAAGNTLDRVVNLGYLHGPISAFAYASGYVARKQGLNVTPDAVYGTMIGAATALVCYLAFAIRLEGLRADVRATFAGINPWLWLAGILTSCGQLTYFAALKYTTISKMALITSMEVFVTMFMTRLLYSGEHEISPAVVLAALLGVAGTLLIIVF